MVLFPFRKSPILPTLQQKNQTNIKNQRKKKQRKNTNKKHNSTLMQGTNKMGDSNCEKKGIRV